MCSLKPSFNKFTPVQLFKLPTPFLALSTQQKVLTKVITFIANVKLILLFSKAFTAAFEITPVSWV